jgi:CTD small phosphatase-like protein 2
LDLKKTLIIDNFVHSFGLQLENGIPILEWISDKNDKELLFLQKYLIEAIKQDDVREFNRNQLKILNLLDFY